MITKILKLGTLIAFLTGCSTNQPKVITLRDFAIYVKEGSIEEDDLDKFYVEGIAQEAKPFWYRLIKNGMR